MIEPRSEVVATVSAQSSPPAHAQTSPPTHTPTSRAINLSACLRDARARAEEILREHPRYDGRTGATCQPCLVDYPCDAVRAAQDVIAITAKLHVGRPLSSKALVELMAELVDLVAKDTAREKPKADRTAPAAEYGPRSAALTPN